MAKIEWYSTKFQGVTARKHDSRKHGIKFDEYFRGQYQAGGKRQTVGFGWSSEGWTAQKVYYKINEFKKNAKQGKKPTNLKQERELAQEINRKKDAEEKKRDKEKTTFSEFVDSVYLPYAEKRKKANTIYNEKIYLGKWIYPDLEKKQLREIDDTDIETIDGKMIDAGKSPRTRQCAIGIVRHILNHAIRKKYYTNMNPVKQIDMPKVNNKRERYLSEDEAALLLDTLKAKNPALHDSVLMALHTGMRAGEIHKLQWKYVNFETKQVYLPDTKDAAKGGKPKYCKMSDDVFDMLKNRDKNKISEWVFPDKNGNQRKQVPKHFFSIVKDLFNKNVTDPRDKVVFHTLRHTFASWQLQNGVPLAELQHFLGVSDFALVQRYAHHAKDLNNKAVEIFNNPKTPEPDPEPEAKEMPDNVVKFKLA
ncbi:MAG: site-specific integrase [Desulfobacterium sp.]|nr:site-specific integrase [Desulfobacterium sp.]